MAWLILVIAGLFETLWAWTMKLSHGFTRPVPAAITLVAMALSVWLLAAAMRSLPLGTAYAVWTGIGTLGAFVLGVVLLGEAATPMRLTAVGLILGGIVLMKLGS